MKQQTEEFLTQAIRNLISDQTLDEQCISKIELTRTKNPQHGDYTTNIAMVCAKQASMAPRDLAQTIVNNLQGNRLFRKIDIAGPGFINFHIHSNAQFQVVTDILQQGSSFGCNQSGSGQRIQIEYVSANPTGPLHVGHGRGAAYGATLANLYKANGYQVEQEYYVNDAGRQMDILASSVWLRYLELCGHELEFPSNGYRGDYVWDIAATIHRQHAGSLADKSGDLCFENLPADEPHGGDKEAHIDAVIQLAKQSLGETNYKIFFNQALSTILDDIKDDLAHFGVHFDRWYLEHSLVDSGKVESSTQRLRDNQSLYVENGATWFKSTQYGDEKDRVVIRENGQATYFASDIAYHLDKFERGFDHMINIWGADHHGYIPRVKAALTALNQDADKLDVLLVQFANLYRGNERLSMSTRSGEFVTLRWLRKEVGNDATRFFYVMRRCDQHLDFDLELALSTSNENPVYYVQYSHARICTVLSKLHNAGYQQLPLEKVIDYLDGEIEGPIAQHLSAYPDVIRNACDRQAPHLVANYLKELAQKFHSYYNTHQIITDDLQLRSARAYFIEAIRNVIANALTLLGVSAPEKM